MAHVTVLKKETIDTLNLTQGSIVVDCTLGSGGHAREILARIGPSGTYIGIDADPAAIEDNAALKKEFKATIHLCNGNFKDLPQLLKTLQVPAVDAIVADLGWRMEQFASTSGEPRGFSFGAPEPLLMTYGNAAQYSFTAADIVNEWAEEDIANVIFGYGEDRKARQIAKAIVAYRTQQPFTNALELATLIKDTLKIPAYKQKTHPATRTFQALRIAVNDEFDVLKSLITDGLSLLRNNGRMSIITFHSLEDRIVKHTFREYALDPCYSLVHKKPIIPTAEEIINNPRSRSAKLRTIKKLP